MCHQPDQEINRGTEDDTSAVRRPIHVSCSVTLNPNLYTINNKFDENPDLGLTDEQILCYHRWKLVGHGPVTNEPWYDCVYCKLRKEDYKKYRKYVKGAQKDERELDEDDLESLFGAYKGVIF